MNVSEDRGMGLAGSGSPQRLRDGVERAAPLRSPHPSTTSAPHRVPPLPTSRPPARRSVLPPRSVVRRFCRCWRTTDMNTVLCRMKWLNLPGTQRIHLFSCLRKKGEGSLQQREGISLMLWQNTSRAWAVPWGPLAGSSKSWGGLSTVSPPACLPPEGAARTEVPGEKVRPPPVPPLPSSPSNCILLKAGGGGTNQHAQNDSGKPYIKGQKPHTAVRIFYYFLIASYFPQLCICRTFCKQFLYDVTIYFVFSKGNIN